ncbi:O-antigen ligase family protein [Hymenobacter arizonensis]|uniref:O-antigen ligase n=1 Tax=Hymenobacter arizonensis TaxID=1227077 RepID=A0A1I6AB79_HYMAR|nr:O-antigen ligase family protein [Hymenobacter arizonensis]SFQ65939.1 O-antigen ligase [Hymenobacter arizonensis]
MNSSRYRSLLLLLFYSSLFSLPLSINWVAERWNVGMMLFSEPLMVLTVAAAAVGGLLGWVAVPRLNLLDKLVGLHFGALLLATVFSTDLLISAKFFITLLLYVSFGYGLPRLLAPTRSEWLAAVGSLALGTALLAVYVVVQQALQGISYQLSYTIAEPFLLHGHTNLTVMLEPLILVLNMVLLYHTRNEAIWKQVLTVVLLIGVLSIVAFSYSRASYASLAAQAMLLLFYAGWKTGRKLLLPWALAGLVILTSWQMLQEVHPQTTAPASPQLITELKSVSDFSPANESNAERKNRWIYSLKLFKQYPVLGAGPGTFADRYLEFVNSTPNHSSYYTTLRRMNAHNLYLSWLVEAGALGLITGLLLLGYVVWRVLRRAFRWPAPLGQVALSAYFLYFLMHSLTQDFWQEPRVVVIFWLAVGLLRFWDEGYAASASVPGWKARVSPAAPAEAPGVVQSSAQPV